MSTLEDLIQKVNRLEADREIRAVMAEYLYRVDRSEPAEAIAELFTEDAVWEARGHLAEFGTTQGRRAIADMFAGLPGSLPFTAHFVTNPVVVVSEDATTARGRWHTLELATTADPSEQLVMVAWYDNDFVRVGDTWQIHHVRYEDSVVFPYADGWIDTRYISSLTLERIPHA